MKKTPFEQNSKFTLGGKNILYITERNKHHKYILESHSTDYLNAGIQIIINVLCFRNKSICH